MSQASNSILLAVILLTLSAGCQSRPRTDAMHQQRPIDPAIRSDSEAVQRLVMELQTAPDTTTEADILRRLHQFQADRNLMYKVTAVRIDTNVPVRAASMYPYPLRADVEVYRGVEPVYTFSFVPRDNRNLALLGE